MKGKQNSTLEVYKKTLRRRNYSEQTIRSYSFCVGNFFAYFKKDAYHISIREAKAYIENYNYSSVSQQNQIISSIKLLYKEVLGRKLRDLKISRPKKEKKLPKVIDSECLKETILGVKNLKHKAILMIGYSCALRVSEVINLKIEDVDSKRMLINIRNAKGRKDRIVVLSETMLETLREYYKEYKPKEYLFNGQSKMQYSTTSCNKIVKKYLGERFHYHMLRHSSATTMFENGTDISVIQKILGHEDIKTSLIYTHISKNKLRGAHLPI